MYKRQKASQFTKKGRGALPIIWLTNTYTGDFLVPNPDQPSQELTIPEDLGTENIHLILEVTDNGEPALVRYRRVILQVD
jgi:hypothetical protein